MTPGLCCDLGFRPNQRYGEADHPGPGQETCTFRLGTSNPSGLRTKEGVLTDWGEGIWCLAETQLSASTQPTSAKAIKHFARLQGRNVRVHAGGPAPVRAHSLWAGAWTGVLTASDYPSRSLRLDWPVGVYESGRVLATFHDVNGLLLTGAVIYGYPAGSTYPQARAATDDLLKSITTHLVYGRQGPRFVAGDFNHDSANLDEIRHWEANGWVEAQSLALMQWGQPVQPTCKHSTQRDLIFLSPELAQLCRAVQVTEDFVDHATVTVTCEAPPARYLQRTWPRPSEIPWSSVDVDAWHQGHCSVPPCHCASDSTAWYRDFSSCYERSLSGFVPDLPGRRLPNACRGRASLTKPRSRQIAAPLARPSRPGEVSLRCDLVGREVLAWFKQLRRLQSLVHSLRAGKSSAEAQVYRADLWHRICECRSFCGGFRVWWSRRHVQLQGSPQDLPRAVPSAEVGALIYEDFQSNFRAFEAWNNRNRGKALQNKYEGDREQLFKELQRPRPDKVDTMHCVRVYSILEVDNHSNQVALEHPADARGASTWKLDGLPCKVHSFDGPVCSIEFEQQPEIGQELEQHQLLSQVEHIQQEFRQHWEPRWQKHAHTPPDAWQRVVGFCTAFLPSCSFDLQPISVETWVRTLRKYKATAARGADGFAKMDLLSMPHAFTVEILNLLELIEAGVLNWPEQMLIGLIMSLDKHNQKAGPDAFRPICVLSLVYRTYASIRARQLLKLIAQVIDGDAHGFLPAHETKQLWISVQASIELAVLQGQDLLGFGADLVKAFNGLPRVPVFHAARCVGIPDSLLRAWGSFLGGLRRHFVIRHEVGEPIQSHTGFPEGDPLSTVAMVLVDWCWHLYMHHFSPSCVPLSFVDNLTCLAHDAAELAQTLAQTECFADMWDLELDRQKTFVWALQPTSRKTLKALGLTVVDCARDLGGLMTYGKRVRVSIRDEMCAALAPMWQRLKKSRAPTAQKVALLPIKFWSSLLHGAAGCLLCDSRLTSLRAAATRAIGICPAGSSSALRLALSPDMLADPGFFQFWHLLCDLRRVGRKQPQILPQWVEFVSAFDGRYFPGPFSSLLQICARLGWSMQPPLIFSATGLAFDLFRAPKGLLRYMAEQAWITHVAKQHNHRQTMRELLSVDLELAHLDAGRLSALETSRVQALQSGSNIANSQHCKYDATKSAVCDACGVLDTVRHKVCDCSKYAHCRAEHREVLEGWETWPQCMTHHLLVPANPYVPELLRGLSELQPQMPTRAGNWHFQTWQDVFTDGTKLFEGRLALAAWSVVNATLGVTLDMGPLPGAWQTVPRAELHAALFAFRWGLLNRVKLQLWSDAAYVVDGVQALLQGEAISDDADNYDLWEQLEMILQCYPAGAVGAKHVPSHLDIGLCESPFEEWVAQWNDRADRQADLANRNRAHCFVQLHQAACGYHTKHAAGLRALRAVYLNIAVDTGQQRVRVRDMGSCGEPELPAWEFRDADIGESLHLCWEASLERAVSMFPIVCLKGLLSRILDWDQATALCLRVSWLEIVFMLKAVDFRFWHRLAGKWEPVADNFHGPKPTLAGCLAFVRSAGKELFRNVGVGDRLCEGINLVSFGVVQLQDGVCMGLPASILEQARHALATFTAARPLRRAADYSRSF